MAQMIGLFGTCGDSTWRNSFIERYDRAGISYFNPQVGTGEWHPGLIEEENHHFCRDDIILFPVLSETLGSGSLGEIGFSAMNALRINRLRFFVFLVDDECTAHDDPVILSDNRRARALVKSKLAEVADGSFNVFLVETIETMLDLSVRLYRHCQQLEDIEVRFKRA